MASPEALLKTRIRNRLRLGGDYIFSPVQMGLGAATVDILGASKRLHGRFYGIEVKTPGNKPTPRQALCLEDIKKAGGIAFWTDSWESFLRTAVVWGLVGQE